MLKTIYFMAAAAFVTPVSPDPVLSPGTFCHANAPDFTGYAELLVPYCLENVTEEVKERVFWAYQIPKEERDQYEISHVIPLFLGGSNGFSNLWPEHVSMQNARQVEECLFLWLDEGLVDYIEALQIATERWFYTDFGSCGSGPGLSLDR